MDLSSFADKGPFDVVLADPPWMYYGDPNKMAAAAKHYRLMPDEEIFALPVRRLLAPRAVVFMWVTSTSIERAFPCFRAWGLTFRGIAFDWVKTRADGTPMGARGIRPSIVKPITEQVLAASNGEPGNEDPTVELVLAGSTVPKGRPLRLSDESIRQTVFAPVRGHSEKPSEVHERIERMYPDARKLEMFARAARPGWHLFGDQAPEAIVD
jgi:N6-adenosine-specific RNA methylase IME4